MIVLKYSQVVAPISRDHTIDNRSDNTSMPTSVLKEKYMAALEYTDHEKSAIIELDEKSGHGKRELNRLDNHLVFYSLSSDYCNADSRRGSIGTYGR